MSADALTDPRATQTELSGAEIVLRALVDQGVEYIFGYPGGAVLPIYDALFQQERVRHVLTKANVSGEPQIGVQDPLVADR